MENCIFCKIINKEIPSTILFEDDYCIAFKDTNPQAPFHVLFVPKIHLTDITEVTKENEVYIEHIYSAIMKVTKEQGIADDGFRIVVNTGVNGAQTVKHLHFHVLGGKKLSERVD